MITAQMVQRFRDSNMKEMRVTSIQYLQTVKDRELEKFTIILDLDKVDDTTVSDLLTIIKEQPGATHLYLSVHDSESNRPLTLRSGSDKISINKKLINFIKENEALNYVIN